MSISILNRQNVFPIKELTIKRRLGKLLKELKKSQFEISLVLTEDEEIKTLNKNFRGKDKSTNVLAFTEDGTFPTPGLTNFLGEIILSTETVLKESKDLNIPEGELFYFYTIHGLLHLLGYDHTLSALEEERQEKETERLMTLIKHNL